jgi:SAM-dependent methyltransferase
MKPQLPDMNPEQQKKEPSIYYWPQAGKLIFLKEKATPEFWDRKWQARDWEKEITRSRKDIYKSHILKKYLPDKNSRILEGGCGTGHIVDAMDYWGYKAIGVDFAPETIAKIKELMPNLDVRCGDVKALDFEDEYFDGYWSLGIIEHFWQGYDDILKEMNRVLKVGGYAFVSFPCISRLDRLKIALSGYTKFTAVDMPENFYQFGLDVNAVRKDFERAGFDCRRIRRRDGWEGLQRHWAGSKKVRSVLQKLSRKSFIVRLFKEGTNYSMAPLCGHGALLVLRKQKTC